MTLIFLIDASDQETFDKVSDVLINTKPQYHLAFDLKDFKVELVASGGVSDIIKITVCGEQRK